MGSSSKAQRTSTGDTSEHYNEQDEVETFQEMATREDAARILASNEMLMWHALGRDESIPQTRRHYERVLYGFTPLPHEADSDDDAETYVWEASEAELERMKPSRSSSTGSSRASTKRGSVALMSDASSTGAAGAGGRAGAAAKADPGEGSARSDGGKREKSKRRKSSDMPLRLRDDESEESVAGA